MDESREDIPRIYIDSLPDWHRMKAKFTNAVMERFDQRIRQNGLESKRSSLLPHVQQFIDTTFEKAKPNVRINGKKFEELRDEDDDRGVEPFDEALDRETWSLYNQRLQWDLELATKRRNRPLEVTDLLTNLFELQEVALQEIDEPTEEDEDRPDTSLPDETVLAETRDTFSKLSALSEGLHQTVTTQDERLGRLRDVEEEVNALKS
ncbi:hypothetical protein F5148DRAFT_1281984 [Russula earlei]|uniref:Uncharacterized protein n=1 Tax=Russula earlei TaxID=71964 RepID=A0ACC0UFH1_9AGAM|nr:hypothetical protein F5148DRAFT_1281984 [Russula earlei]